MHVTVDTTRIAVVNLSETHEPLGVKPGGLHRGDLLCLNGDHGPYVATYLDHEMYRWRLAGTDNRPVDDLKVWCGNHPSGNHGIREVSVLSDDLLAIWRPKR